MAKNAAVICLFLAGLLAITPAAVARGGHSGGSHFGSHSGSSYHSGRSSSHIRSGTSSSSGVHYTHSHTTKSGHFVRGHWSTNKNSSKHDNFSTRGNVNPYTGKAGTKRPD